MFDGVSASSVDLEQRECTSVLSSNHEAGILLYVDGVTRAGLVDGCMWRPSRKRFWNIFTALEGFLKSDARWTGEEVEAFIGHVTSLLLIRTEILACLSTMHVFMRESHAWRQHLWSSARQELCLVSAVMAKAHADISRQWSSSFLTCNASLDRVGVCQHTCDSKQAASMERLKEIPAGY